MEGNIVTLIGAFFGTLGAFISGFFAWKQVQSKQEVKEKVSDNTTKIETAKVNLASETNRIDQVLDAQKDFIKLLQEEVVRLNTRIDGIQTRMEICLEERGRFKINMEKIQALYEALDVQFKATKEYRKHIKEVEKLIREENKNDSTGIH